MRPRTFLLRLLLLALALAFPRALTAQGITPDSVITTVAGSGRVFHDNGGPATSAALGPTCGVAADSAGNVYTGDGANNLIYKISPNGVITVVAGNNLRGYSGDGGPATSASFNFNNSTSNGLCGLALDRNGNLFVSDYGNSRIRKISPDGMVTTAYGGPSGFSGDNGPAVSARFSNPAGLFFDKFGNLYFSDLNNHRIRKITADGIITTVAGNGIQGFSGDAGPALNASLNTPTMAVADDAGNLYISDRNNARVRKVDASGIITTVAGVGQSSAAPQDGVPATTVSLGLFVLTMAIDELGVPYIGAGRVWRLNPDGTLTTIIGGSGALPTGDGGPANRAGFSGPQSLFISSRNIYIADAGNGRVRRIDSGGIITTVAGTTIGNYAGDGGPGTLALLSSPNGMTVDVGGNLLFTDSFNNRVRSLSPAGTISTVAGNGSPGFSGDRGAATAAAIFRPRGVTFDPQGNLYIADGSNSRIRRVDSSGLISTFAGGFQGFGNDGIPATSAGLNNPEDLASDAGGNIYIADRLNGRIRRVDRAGIISTVAGNGTFDFAGDGGLATQAALNNPNGITLDRTGNLYIADNFNRRVRRVDQDGTIRTFAGGGTVAAENAPATSLFLGGPNRVAFDASGNLFILDGRIRKVSTDGTISSISNSNGLGYVGDGGPVWNARFNGGNGMAFDAAGNLYISDTGNDRVRKVWVTPPTLSVGQPSLSFRTSAGSGPTAPQLLDVSSSITGLLWSARTTTTSLFNWLSVSPAVGAAPGIIAVNTDSGPLQAGTYQGSVIVSAPGATPPSITVPVALTVDPPVPPQMGTETTSLFFDSVLREGNPAAQALRVLNTGGGSLNWTAEASVITPAGGSWLSLSSPSGVARPAVPGSVQVSVDAAALAAGTYSAVIRLTSSTTNQFLNIPVTFQLSGAGKMLLSQRGLSFTGVAGGNAVPGQNFGVLNVGRGVMNWTAQATTLSGGNWLSISPASGASTAGSFTPPLMDVNVNTAGMAAGQYSAQIVVNSPDANNSPQVITVALTVLPAGSVPPPVIRPTGLIFIRQAGTSSPGSQTVRIQTAAPSVQTVAANAFPATGTGWLTSESLLPTAFTISSTDPKTLVVQPTVNNLAPGEYFGVLTLAFPRDNSSQTVNVLFVVTPGGPSAIGAAAAGTVADGANLGGVAAACNAQRLFVTAQSLSSNFVVPVGFPTAVMAAVRDDCDNEVSDAVVTASFDNGDRLLQLVAVGAGTYQASWPPGNSGARQSFGPVGVTIRAARSGLAIAETRVNGQITAGGGLSIPAVNSGGIVNAASSAAGEPLAPGSIVSVYGSNLATTAVGANTLPLPTTLADASLNVAGREVPMFYSSNGQINAQLPFDLPPNSRQQAYVRVRGGGSALAVSLPESITVASTRPAIFTVNQQGNGQGAILNQNFSANAPGNPEARGRVIQIFATGLGATTPAVAAGVPAPSNPPATTAIPVQATVGGQPAAVQFAGLAPGFVGLYQVNITVPAGVPPGPAVPLQLTQDGVPSNTVTVAVQ